MFILNVFLLIAFANASPQLFPIRVVYLRIYSPPPLIFQARLGGGFRAYLPDDCGVESFEFKCRKDRGDDWKGGNVTMKMGDHWIYEDPKLRLNPGERLYYTGTVMNRGKPFPLHQDAEWIVPEKLPSAFTPPVVKEAPKCPEDRSGEPTEPTKTTTQSAEKPTSETTVESTSQTTTPKSETNPEEESTSQTSPKSEKTTTTTTTPKSETTTTESTTPKEETSKPGCPWEDITPADTKEKQLQNSLGRIQCDLAAFALRTALLNEQLTQELIDLKKLNYATVARLQRLESLTRSLPRNLPYPF